MADLAAMRHINLIEYLKGVRFAGVEELASVLGVTQQTIRKDLDLLAGQRQLTRVRGGAMLESRLDNIGHAARRAMAAAAKDAIGRRAAALVPDNASLFLNIGTTTEAVARALLDHDHLLVVTNNLNVADILGAKSGIEVIVAGGRLRSADRAVVGALTVDFIRGFKVDYAVIGTSALDDEGDLLDFDINEVKVSQTIIAQARRVMLVADATKFERQAPARIGSLSDVDIFVTDTMPDARRAAFAERHGVDIVLAG
ncbi:DeoR/GlpR family DNA-binding transcription regulator [Novosphingobium sp.]|uniref:DeoR/GlpR family DNA-binding transcription regulator n=1 Tax=Novosphingobium sp. TaxID=1874826 RepID=UPI002FDEE79F